MERQWRKDPPPDGRSEERDVVRYDWRAVGEAARSRPGEWMMVDDEARQYLVSRIRKDRIPALRAPGWQYEAVTRQNRTTDEGTRLCELWITAIPDERTNT